MLRGAASDAPRLLRQRTSTAAIPAIRKSDRLRKGVQPGTPDRNAPVGHVEPRLQDLIAGRRRRYGNFRSAPISAVVANIVSGGVVAAGGVRRVAVITAVFAGVMRRILAAMAGVMTRAVVTAAVMTVAVMAAITAATAATAVVIAALAAFGEGMADEWYSCQRAAGDGEAQRGQGRAAREKESRRSSELEFIHSETLLVVALGPTP
jgi:hypothetical protein